MHQGKRPKIAAVIPALNEAKTIGKIVKVLTQSPFVDEVIVVSGGSEDQTINEARAAGATNVLDYPQSTGKGTSMIKGVQATDAPIILFLDGDLKGLTREHVEQLVLPVISGARQMNIGLRDKGELFTELTKYLPLISGERALRREIFEAIDPKYLEGFMVEASLNYYCQANDLPFGTVFLQGLTMRRKFEKVGWLTSIFGPKGYIQMTYEVFKAMITVRLAKLRGKF